MSRAARLERGSKRRRESTDYSSAIRLLSAAVEEGLWTKHERLRFFFSTLFRGITFQGKSFLDVGGGTGLCTFYAECAGAVTAVCLEPEGAGSSKGFSSAFQRLKTRLRMVVASFHPVTLQEYARSGSTPFDVILLHNSINHLDEEACMHLLRDPLARQRYLEFFRELFRLTAPGGYVIICDCSPKNLFAAVGLRNPFVPTIEWTKHQTPETWVEIAEQAGYAMRNLTWTSFNCLGRVGALVLGNRLAAYFFMSHFRLVLQRPLATCGVEDQ